MKSRPDSNKRPNDREKKLDKDVIEKELDPAVEMAKSKRKYSSIKELEKLYHKPPKRSYDIIYIFIGLVITGIGIVLAFTTFYAFIIIVMGIFVAAYGFYDPEKEYKKKKND